jgi:two-component system, cell cycle sensor histidine kinase and response regulator CckA
MPGDSKHVHAFRQKAEKSLSKKPEELAVMSGTDLQKLVHELSVHQVELEMQNEELRQSREQLEESRSEFANLYDFAPVGYLTFDKTGAITRANLTATGLLGMERSLLIKKPFVLFIHPESQDRFFLYLQRVLDTTTTQTCQLVLKRKDGTSFDVQLEGVAVQVNGTTLIRAALTDITERKRAEEALRRQADLLDLAHDALLVRDMEGRITFWNRSAEEKYGWTKAEALGKVTHSFLKTQFSVPFDEYIEVLTKEGRWEGELVHTTKGGRQIRVLSRQALQRDGVGNPLAILEINLDITETRRTEQQLRQALKMEALGTLIGGIAHDFNNILAAMIGFTELAKSRALKGSRQEHHLQRVQEAGLRGRQLVKQLLTFSRKTEQQRVPLQLGSLVKEVMKLLRASIPSTIRIDVKIDGKSGLILGDPIQIQQVLMNLCTNAAHAMRETGGALDIELSNYSASPSKGPERMKPGTYLKLAVRDTGEGIPANIMDKIFDPFFTTKKQGEGTGLGLSVVQGIVTQHGGYIAVESTHEKGSAFAIYFPKLEERHKDKERIVGDESMPRGCERILFVDDEAGLVEMGQEMLTDLGYQVESRTSSKEALAILLHDPSRFDLVITDQTMPDMTGIELAKEVLAVRPDIPVILCTGFSQTTNGESAKAMGVKGFVMKPLTKSEIAKTIRKALDGQVG